MIRYVTAQKAWVTLRRLYSKTCEIEHRSLRKVRLANVAGVVGKKEFAYDIWGDAVNVASRMESSGEIGKVNISGETYEWIKEEFECVYRGRIYAKNKGDVDMYFVEGWK